MSVVESAHKALMSDASISGSFEHAVAIDANTLDEIVRICRDLIKQSRVVLLMEAKLTELDLEALTLNGPDPKLPYEERSRLQDVVRAARAVDQITATVKLKNGVKVQSLAPDQIISHSSIGDKAIKSIEITAGRYGGSAYLHLTVEDGMSLCSWSVRGEVEIVERAHSELEVLFRGAQRPWSMLAHNLAGLAFLMLPAVALLVTVVVVAVAAFIAPHSTLVSVPSRFLSVALASISVLNAIWVVAAIFLSGPFMRWWRSIFPRVEFNLGSNATHVAGISKLRVWLGAAFFTVVVVPTLVWIIGVVFSAATYSPVSEPPSPIAVEVTPQR